MALTVSTDFTSTASGNALAVQHGRQFTYAITGTFVATLKLEKSYTAGSSWEIVNSFTSTGTGSVEVQHPAQGTTLYRFRCSAYTSGTATAAMTEVVAVDKSIQTSTGLTSITLNADGTVSFPYGYATGFANGTVGSPSMFFTSDTDTGFYRIATDSIGVSCGGAATTRFGLSGGEGWLTLGNATNSAGLYTGRADGYCFVGGSTSSSTGRNMLLYGNTHATLANQFLVRAATTVHLAINSGGNVGLGGTFDADCRVYIRGANPSTATGQLGLLVQSAASSSATSSSVGVQAQAVTSAASYTCGLGAAFSAMIPSIGSGSTLTRHVNFYGQVGTGAGSNTWGGDNNSFNGNWVFNFTSTNPSLLKGQLTLGGSASDDRYSLYISGLQAGTSGTSQSGVYVSALFPSTGTGQLSGYNCNVSNGASTTSTSLVGYLFTNRALGGTSIGRVAAFGGAMPTSGTYNAFLCDDTTNFVGSYGLYLSTTNPSLLSGTLGVGGAQSTSYVVQVGATNPLSGAVQGSVKAVVVGTSAATGGVYGFVGEVTTAAASFTSSFVVNFYANQAAKGSGSTITRRAAYGGTHPTDGTTGNCFICDNTSYSGNFFLNSTSTLPSKFSGVVGVRQATDNVTDAGPTQAEMVTALGAANVTTGGIGIIKDANADTNCFICVTNGTSWYYLKLTKGA